MLQRMLTVTDHNDRAITGTVAVNLNETEWRFRPQANWIAGKYSVRVMTLLEDLAGNSIAKLFEVDVTSSDDTGGGRQTDLGPLLSLPFEVAYPSPLTSLRCYQSQLLSQPALRILRFLAASLN